MGTLLFSCASSSARMKGASPAKNQEELNSVVKENGFASQRIESATEIESRGIHLENSEVSAGNPLEYDPKKAVSENKKSDRIETPLLQWYELLVQTDQPVGAYELELSFDPRLATFQKLAGGNSVHFAGLPWCTLENIHQGQMILSSFHGAIDGPSGEVSLGRILFQSRSKESFSLSGRFRKLVSPDQKEISGQLISKLETDFGRESPAFFSKPSKNRLPNTGTEIFVITTFPLGGYALILEYDPTILHIQEIQGGSSPYFASLPFSSPQTYQSGRTKISAFYGGFSGPIGKISICWIVFKTLQKGRSPLRIEQLEMSDSEGQLKEGTSALSLSEIEVK